MTAKQINEEAKRLLAAGKPEDIKKLAADNFLSEYDAEDFINGDVEELTNNLILAMAKIEHEAKAFEHQEIISDWIEYIKSKVSEEDEVAVAVASEGKSLKGCISEILKWSFKNAHEVDKDILKACSINYKVSLGIPGMKTAKKLISEYYLKESDRN